MDAETPTSYQSVPEKALPLAFSSRVIVAITIVVVLISIYLSRESVLGNRNANAMYPTYSLGRVVDRDLELDAALAKAPEWERFLQKIFLGPSFSWKDDAIEAYRDLLEYYQSQPASTDPGAVATARAYLVVLLAEVDRSDEAQAELRLLAGLSEGEGIAAVLRFAYGTNDLKPTPSETEAIYRLPERGWTVDKLRMRLAAKAGDLQLVREIEAELINRGQRWKQWALLFTVLNIVLLVSGLAGLVVALAMRRKSNLSLTSSRSTPWPWQLGFGVFMWSVFSRQVLILTGGFLESYGIDMPYQLLNVVALLFLVALIHRYLLASSLTFSGAFGLDILPRCRLLVIGLSLILFEVELVGSNLISAAMWQLGFRAHWTEGIDEDLFWGDWLSVALTTFDYVVWAPLFEEIAFRGVLYTSLRSLLGPVVACLIAAGMYSGWHFYSLDGFMVLMWSGVVWTVAYERFGSLWPTILSHALINLIVVGGFLVFYR